MSTDVTPSLNNPTSCGVIDLACFQANCRQLAIHEHKKEAKKIAWECFICVAIACGAMLASVALFYIGCMLLIHAQFVLFLLIACVLLIALFAYERYLDKSADWRFFGLVVLVVITSIILSAGFAYLLRSRGALEDKTLKDYKDLQKKLDEDCHREFAKEVLNVADKRMQKHLRKLYPGVDNEAIATNETIYKEEMNEEDCFIKAEENRGELLSRQILDNEHLSTWEGIEIAVTRLWCEKMSKSTKRLINSLLVAALAYAVMGIYCLDFSSFLANQFNWIPLDARGMRYALVFIFFAWVALLISFSTDTRNGSTILDMTMEMLDHAAKRARTGYSLVFFALVAYAGWRFVQGKPRWSKTWKYLTRGISSAPLLLPAASQLMTWAAGASAVMWPALIPAK